MTKHSINTSQRKAARLAGFLFLFIMATAVFASGVRTNLFSGENAAEIVRNITASAQLFRFSLAVDLICFAAVVVLSLAMYIILKPVNKNLAMLGLFWRLGEAFILGLNTLNGYVILTLTDGTILEAGQSQTLVQLFINAHTTGFNIGMIFVALGTTVFNYILFESNYIPRALAALGVLGSLALLFGTFAILLLPAPSPLLEYLPYIPGFFFEVTVGFWLLIKGINLPKQTTRPLPIQEQTA